MALIKVNRSGRVLENIAPTPSLGIDSVTGEMRFDMIIGPYTVSITRRDKDKILNAWRVLQEERENVKPSF